MWLVGKRPTHTHRTAHRTAHTHTRRGRLAAPPDRGHTAHTHRRTQTPPHTTLEHMTRRHSQRAAHTSIQTPHSTYGGTDHAMPCTDHVKSRHPSYLPVPALVATRQAPRPFAALCASPHHHRHPARAVHSLTQRAGVPQSHDQKVLFGRHLTEGLIGPSPSDLCNPFRLWIAARHH